MGKIDKIKKPPKKKNWIILLAFGGLLLIPYAIFVIFKAIEGCYIAYMIGGLLLVTFPLWFSFIVDWVDRMRKNRD